MRVDPEVGAAGPLVAGADAIAPVILIGKATAGPTDHTGLHLAQGFDHFFAKAMDVWNRGLLITDPDTVINIAADMLDEMAVNFGGDDGSLFIEKNLDSRVGGAGLAGEEGLGGEQGRSGCEKLATMHVKANISNKERMSWRRVERW